MPITWRNVNGGSDATSARLLSDAGRSFDGMFDGLGNILEQKNQQLQRQDTEAFKQALASQFSTPEALQAARESGALDQLRSRFQYLDTTQTNAEAMDNRLKTLRQQATAEHEWNQAKQARTDKPLMNDFDAQLNNLDLEMGTEAAAPQLKALRESVNNSELSAGARNTLLQRINQFGQSVEDEEQSDYAHRQRQVQAGRQATTFQQQQEDRAQRKREESATKLADRKYNEVIAQYDSPSQARAAYQQWLQSDEARGAGVPASYGMSRLATVDQGWQGANGLTSAQMESLSSREASLQRDHQRIVEDNPVDPEMSFRDDERIDLQEAIGMAEEQVDDFWTKDNINEAVNALKKDRGIKNGDNVPFGNLVAIALKGAKERDVWGDDYDLDSDDMREALFDVYDRWIASTKNQEAVRESEDSVAKKLSDHKQALKNTNQLRRRGGSQ